MKMGIGRAAGMGVGFIGMLGLLGFILWWSPSHDTPETRKADTEKPGTVHDASKAAPGDAIPWKVKRSDTPGTSPTPLLPASSAEQREADRNVGIPQEDDEVFVLEVNEGETKNGVTVRLIKEPSTPTEKFSLFAGLNAPDESTRMEALQRLTVHLRHHPKDHAVRARVHRIAAHDPSGEIRRLGLSTLLLSRDPASFNLAVKRAQVDPSENVTLFAIKKLAWVGTPKYRAVLRHGDSRGVTDEVINERIVAARAALVRLSRSPVSSISRAAQRGLSPLER